MVVVAISCFIPHSPYLPPGLYDVISNQTKRIYFLDSRADKSIFTGRESNPRTTLSLYKRRVSDHLATWIINIIINYCNTPLVQIKLIRACWWPWYQRFDSFPSFKNNEQIRIACFCENIICGMRINPDSHKSLGLCHSYTPSFIEYFG